MIAITKSPTKDKIDKYILALIIVQYIEDIIHGCAEIQNFPSSVEKYFMSERSEHVKYFFNTRREISYLQAAM